MSQKLSVYHLERSMVGNDLTKDEVLALEPEDIVKVYSGKDGKCCCGCAGKFWISPRAASVADLTWISEEEISDRQVTRILKLVQKGIREDSDSTMLGSNFASVTIGSRLYIVYPFGEVKHG